MSGRLNRCLKILSQHIKHFVFPPLCYHCNAPVEEERHIICSACFDLLTLIDPHTRCPYCFAHTSTSPRCHTCVGTHMRLAAASPHQGPLVTLLNQLKFSRKFALAPALAPLLAMQWHLLKWPQPDLIIPIPQTTFQRLQRSYNTSHLLATALSPLLHAPVVPLLKRADVRIPQSALSLSQRRKLSPDTFQWLARRSLADLTLLLIDDTLVTGATLCQAAIRLQEEAPGPIYGLTLSHMDEDD